MGEGRRREEGVEMKKRLNTRQDREKLKEERVGREGRNEVGGLKASKRRTR